jgi:hypothetical protein
MPEVREQLAAPGITVQTSTSAELVTLPRNDRARWRKVIAEANIRAD